jgi:hypothetical protein
LIALTLFLLPTLAQRTGNKTLTDAAQVFQETSPRAGLHTDVYLEARSFPCPPERPLLATARTISTPCLTSASARRAARRILPPKTKCNTEYLQNLFDNALWGLGPCLPSSSLAVRGRNQACFPPLTMALLLAMVCFLGQAFLQFSSRSRTPCLDDVGDLAALGLENAKQEETVQP